MKRFLRLLRKDLEASKLPTGLLSGIILGLMAIVRFKLGDLGSDYKSAAFFAIVLTVTLPILFLPLWLFWQSFQSLRSEWREDTVYTLLVLPVPGWHVTLAKLIGILVEYSVLLVVSVGGGLLLFWRMIEPFWNALPSTSWILGNAFLLYLVSALALAAFVILMQLAFIVGKLVGRAQGLVAIWTWILASWLVGRLGSFLEPIFRWVPPIPLHRVARLELLGRDVLLDWNIASQLGTFLGVIGLFWLTSYLFEHFVEING